MIAGLFIKQTAVGDLNHLIQLLTYSGFILDWFKNKSTQLKPPLDWDYQTGQIGLIEE